MYGHGRRVHRFEAVWGWCCGADYQFFGMGTGLKRMGTAVLRACWLANAAFQIKKILLIIQVRYIFDYVRPGGDKPSNRELLPIWRVACGLRECLWLMQSIPIVAEVIACIWPCHTQPLYVLSRF